MKKCIARLVLVLPTLSAPVFADGGHDWTGAYIGANLGAIWAGSTLTANNLNFVSSSGSYRQNLDVTDVNPGLQFGYLHQLDQNWLLGAEADFTYPATSSEFTAVNGTGSAFDRFKVHNNLQGSLRLRAGYAIDRILPFITAGVSFGSLALNYTNEANNAYSKSTAQTGWVLGAGLEYSVFDKFSARLEYLYTDYGSALNMDIPNVVNISEAAGSAHANMNANVLRAAFNYRF